MSHLVDLDRRNDQRLADLRRFYDCLYRIGEIPGRKQVLRNLAPLGDLSRGVYFFFEGGENRSQSGKGPRVVRVGTHDFYGVGQSTTIWRRLRLHKSGDCRKSIFRKLVGRALRAPGEFPTWGLRGGDFLDALRIVQKASRTKLTVMDGVWAERPLEHRVSDYLGSLEFICVATKSLGVPDSSRAFIAKNATALLSNMGKRPAIDPPSPDWIGWRGDGTVASSGQWSRQHVELLEWDPAFIDLME